MWEDTKRRFVGSLGVCVYVNGTKTYYYQYSIDGARRRVKLGPVDVLSLADARAMAQAYSQKVSVGEDPRPKNAQAEKIDTNGSVEDMINYYIERMKADGKRTHGEVLASIERDVYTHIDKSMPANEVVSEQISEILNKMIIRGAATGSNRLRSYLHAAFAVASKHDNDPANLHKPMRFKLTQNPVSPVPRQNVEKVGERVLSESELATLLRDVQLQGFSPFTKYTILMCLYAGGQRPYEVINTRFEWVNLDAKVWFMSKKITKNKKDHIIPMSEQLTALINESRLFTSMSPFLMCHRLDKGKPMPTSSLSQALKRYCERSGIEPFTPRDLRRTCKTLMTKHGIGTKETLDRLHNHSLNDVSNKHYNKYDYFNEKLEIVCAWGNFIDRLVQ